MIAAGALVGNYAAELARRNPLRERKIAYLTLRVEELAARRNFHENPTHDNLTLWATAAEKLEGDR